MNKFLSSSGPIETKRRPIEGCRHASLWQGIYVMEILIRTRCSHDDLLLLDSWRTHFYFYACRTSLVDHSPHGPQHYRRSNSSIHRRRDHPWLSEVSAAHVALTSNGLLPVPIGFAYWCWERSRRSLRENVKAYLIKPPFRCRPGVGSRH